MPSGVSCRAFDTVWVDGLLFKLTALNFPSYLVKTISSYLHNRTFEASFQTAISTRRGMRAGGLIEFGASFRGEKTY